VNQNQCKLLFKIGLNILHISSRNLKKKKIKMCKCYLAESCTNNIVHTKEKFCVGPINQGMPKIHTKYK